MSYNQDNPNGQATMANSSPVVISSDQTAIPVSYNPGTVDIFGNLITGVRVNQIETDFSSGTVSSKLVTSFVGTGTSTISGGKAIFSTGTGTTSQTTAFTSEVVSYDPGHEIFAEFTAAFTTPTSAASYQKLGWYDANNGLYIGFIGTTFGVTRRSGGVDTTVAKASFSVDTLTGAASSKYTRNGVPEAIDLTKINVFRIRLGWLGAAPILFEVVSPDGVWVTFHKILFPNTSTVPSLQSTSLPITIDVSKTASDATDLIITTICWSAGTTLPANNPMSAMLQSGFSPDPSSNASSSSQQTLQLDPNGALRVRGQVITDEDSFRDDFLGSVLATTMTGTLTFINGSKDVTGVGTFFSTRRVGDYIKLSADAETAYALISEIVSDYHLVLSSAYTGTGGSGIALLSSWLPTTGAGSTIAVSSSVLSITMPTTTGITSGIVRHGDFGPLRYIGVFSLDNRRANQTIQVGLGDSFTSPQAVCYFEFTGTVNTTVTCVSGAGASSLQTSTVTIPALSTTATSHRYEISVDDGQVSFIIDDIILAQHRDHIPTTYQVLDVGVRCINTGTVAGATILSSDLIHFKNFDSLEVSTIASNKPIQTSLASPVAISGTITSTQSVSTYVTSTSVGIEVLGTWTGSMIIEGLVGSTWNSIDAFNSSTELISSAVTANSNYIIISIAGLTQIRVRGNTVLTGTANINLSANNGSFTYPIFARGQGNSIGSYGIQLGGVDATANTFQFQHVNTLGAAGVYLESSNKAAYCCSIVPLTPPATPTDVITIYGSATKTVRILKIVLNTTQTTIGINDWYVIKRSTANTGGTSAAIVSVPIDSNFPAATAVVSRYTVNPTALGTSAGNLAVVNIVSPPIAPGTSGTGYIPYAFDFTNNPIVLRGVAQGVAINFNGAALPGGLSINFNVTFTEE